MITAVIRTAMWGALMVAALYRRYPAFAIMGFLGVVANVFTGVASLVSNEVTAEAFRQVSGSVGVILIAICVWYAFQGMKVRDKLRHPLTKEDLNL